MDEIKEVTPEELLKEIEKNKDLPQDELKGE